LGSFGAGGSHSGQPPQSLPRSQIGAWAVEYVPGRITGVKDCSFRTISRLGKFGPGGGLGGCTGGGVGSGVGVGGGAPVFTSETAPIAQGVAAGIDQAIVTNGLELGLVLPRAQRNVWPMFGVKPAGLNNAIVSSIKSLFPVATLTVAAVPVPLFDAIDTPKDCCRNGWD